MQDWYYIKVGPEKPFRVFFEDAKIKVSVPYPQNIVLPGDKIVVQEVEGTENDTARFGEPVEKNPHRNVHFDDLKIYINAQEKSLNAMSYGYAGFLGDELTILPPVIMNEQKTKAWLIIVANRDGALPKVDQVLTVISDERILSFISKEKLKSDLEKAEPGKPYKLLIAEGKEPIEGYPAYVESELKIEKKAGTLNEDGSINFKERQSIVEVHKDQEIGLFHPERKNVNGRDVYGSEIETEFAVRGPAIGENLYLDEKEGRQVVKAKVNGYIELTKRSINVKENLQINGDIDYEIGNIKFLGDITIKGGVLSGFEVYSFGSLTVNGTCKGANLFASKDMALKGGAIGEKKEDKIKVMGNLRAAYLQNVRLEVMGDLVVDDFIYSSEVYCNGSIEVRAKKGAVVGGTLAAKKKIVINEAGNDACMPTKIICGIDLEFNDKLQSKIQEKENLTNRRESLVSETKKKFSPLLLRNPKLFLPKVEKDKQGLALQILKQISNLGKSIMILESEIEKMEKNGPQFDFKPEVKILKRKHDCVEIEYPSLKSKEK